MHIGDEIFKMSTNLTKTLCILYKFDLDLRLVYVNLIGIDIKPYTKFSNLNLKVANN